jgi:hypothetical protein
MKQMEKLRRIVLALTLAALGAVPLSSSAFADSIDTTINVSVNTSALLGQGTFELALLLTDGSGTGDQNTNISLTGFNFGAGGSGGAVTGDSTGGFSGSLSSGATLFDSSFFNLFAADFTPGNLLSFTAAITSSSLDTPTPDLFQFVILDSSGAPIATTDATGQNTLLTVNLDSAHPTAQQSGIAGTTMPEPNSLISLTLCLFAITGAGFFKSRSIRRVEELTS